MGSGVVRKFFLVRVCDRVVTLDTLAALGRVVIVVTTFNTFFPCRSAFQKKLITSYHRFLSMRWRERALSDHSVVRSSPDLVRPKARILRKLPDNAPKACSFAKSDSRHTIPVTTCALSGVTHTECTTRPRHHIGRHAHRIHSQSFVEFKCNFFALPPPHTR